MTTSYKEGQRKQQMKFPRHSIGPYLSLHPKAKQRKPLSHPNLTFSKGASYGNLKVVWHTPFTLKSNIFGTALKKTKS
jgi:hypothetical protein